MVKAHIGATTKVAPDATLNVLFPERTTSASIVKVPEATVMSSAPVGTVLLPHVQFEGVVQMPLPDQEGAVTTVAVATVLVAETHPLDDKASTSYAVVALKEGVVYDELEAKMVVPPEAYQRNVVLAPTLALNATVPAVHRWPLVTVGAVGKAPTVPLTAKFLVVALVEVT